MILPFYSSVVRVHPLHPGLGSSVQEGRSKEGPVEGHEEEKTRVFLLQDKVELAGPA